MRIILVIVSVLALTKATSLQLPNSNFTIDEDFMRGFIENAERSDRQVLVAILNEYADKIFKYVQKFMLKSELDPFALPDLHEHINYTFILVYHGELDLTKGQIRDISTIHRGNQLKVTYDPEATNILTVVVPITFNALTVNYDYSVKIMGLGPKGGIKAKITNLAVEIELSFDFKKYQASLEHFYIKNSGHIELWFTGNFLIDWLLDLLSNVVTGLLHRVILLVMEAIIKNPIESVINTINTILNHLLQPTNVTSLVL